MASIINELKPVMTKARVLELLLNYVSKNGTPTNDAHVYTSEMPGGGLRNWSFKDLCKLLID